MAKPSHQRETERRFVRSDDPQLTPEANRLLTEEVQAVVGAEEVVVPKGTPDRSQEPHGRRSPWVANLVANRQLIIVTLAMALVVGGIIGLTTGAYWAVVVALALHAVGTLIVTTGAIQLTTQTEHVGPEVAARLEEEGVSDPDRVLTELVEDFTGTREAGGVPEVLSSGNNERTTGATQEPARAAMEQRTAMTPTSGRSPVSGEGSAVEFLPWWVVLGVSVLSVVFALISGGEMWALPAIVVPIGVGWVLLQRFMAKGPGSAADADRPTGDEGSARRRLLPIGAFVVAGVIWLMIVLGWIADLL
jgi:hypothetical protein